MDRNRKDERSTQEELVRRWINHRRTLAGQLHDGPQQDLSLMSLAIGRLKQVDGPGDDLGRTLDELEGVAEEVQRALRSISVELFPPALATKGFVEALITERTRFDKVVEVNGGIEQRVHPDVEVAAFFFCREAVRMLGSSPVAIEVGADGDGLWIEIRTPDSARHLESANLEMWFALTGGRWRTIQEHGETLIRAEWPAVPLPG